MEPLKLSSTPEVFPGMESNTSPLIFQMWRGSRFFQSVAIHRNSGRPILGWFQWEGAPRSGMGLQKVGDCSRSPCGAEREGSSCKCIASELAAGVASNFSCRSCRTIQHICYSHHLLDLFSQWGGVEVRNLFNKGSFRVKQMWIERAIVNLTIYIKAKSYNMHIGSQQMNIPHFVRSKVNIKKI